MRASLERAHLLKPLSHVQRVVERAQYDSDIVERAHPRRRCRADAEGDRPRRRDRRNRGSRRRPAGRHHRARPHAARHRAQDPRRRPHLARYQRRRLDHDADGRPLPLRPADAARKRLPGHHGRRVHPLLQGVGRGPALAHRAHPVRDLHRGDALLPQRHLLPHRRDRRRHEAASRRHRRPPPRPGADRGAGRRGRHARHHRAAQDRRRAAAPDGRPRGAAHRGAVGHQDPRVLRQRRPDLEADRRHLPRLRPRDPPRTTARSCTSTGWTSPPPSTASRPSPPNAAAP